MAPALRSRRLLPWLLSVVFCLLVAVPLVAMLFDVRPQLPDNRAPTDVPPASELTALDTEAWEQLQQAFRDRLPGLDWAVRQDAQLALRLTGRSPNPRVVLGTGNWLFLAETVQRPCLTDEQLEVLGDQLTTLRSAADAAAVRLVVVIAPDKAAIHTDRLREDDLARSCADEDIDRIAHALAGPDLLVPVNLLGGEVAAGRVPYHPRDTHWTTDTAALVVTDLLGRLGLDADMVRTETGQRGTIGDLAVMQGLAPSGPFRCFRVERPGVVLTGQRDDCRWSPQVPIRLTASSTGPELLAPTVFQFDSFGLPMLDVLGPWFESVTAFYKDGGSEQEVLEALEAADTVVLELVQRTLTTTDATGAIDRLVRALQRLAGG